jgi:hypothetical protein
MSIYAMCKNCYRLEEAGEEIDHLRDEVGRLAKENALLQSYKEAFEDLTPGLSPREKGELLEWPQAKLDELEDW